MSKKQKRTKYPLILLILFFSIANLYIIKTLLYIYYDKPKKELYNITIDPKYTFQENCFYHDTFLRYEDQEYTSKVGIDVSEFQDDINWQELSRESIDFAYLRIGRRGATTGLIYSDKKFTQNYKEASKTSIDLGVYFFSQAINQQEAIQEAEFVLNEIKGKEIILPIAYDYEPSGIVDEETRCAALTKEQISQNALAFCQTIEKHGYQPIIYTNLAFSEEHFDLNLLKDYPIWFAQYDVDFPTLTYPFEIWQYSCNGKVKGIENAVDLNIMFIHKNDQIE